MQFEGALVKEQGVTFAIVVVKKEVLDSSTEREKAFYSFRPAFPGVPLILMAQDYRGTPTYCGRKDIVNFLANVPFQAIPWKKYTLN